MDYRDILSNKICINTDYVNKKLTTIVSDTIDDGTIVYEMNEHGYRSIPLKDGGKINVLTLGCSWTMGIGVRNDLIWPEFMSDKIRDYFGVTEISLFNYGMYGVSTSFIAKTLYKIVESGVKPDMVLIMWPGFSRRDYLKPDGSFKKIGGFRAAHDKDLVWKNDEEDHHFLELRNDYQDMMIFWEAYKFVQSITELRDIRVYHTIAGYYYDVFKELQPQLIDTIDYNTFFVPENCYQNDYMGRDNHHPGPEWHFNFSENFFSFIKNRL